MNLETYLKNKHPKIAKLNATSSLISDLALVFLSLAIALVFPLVRLYTSLSSYKVYKIPSALDSLKAVQVSRKMWIDYNTHKRLKRIFKFALSSRVEQEPELVDED